MKSAIEVISGIQYAFAVQDPDDRTWDGWINFLDGEMKNRIIHISVRKAKDTIVVNQQIGGSWMEEAHMPLASSKLALTFLPDKLKIECGGKTHNYFFKHPIRLSDLAFVDMSGVTETTDLLRFTAKLEGAVELSSLEFAILDARLAKLERDAALVQAKLAAESAPPAAAEAEPLAGLAAQ